MIILKELMILENLKKENDLNSNMIILKEKMKVVLFNSEVLFKF